MDTQSCGAYLGSALIRGNTVCLLFRISKTQLIRFISHAVWGSAATSSIGDLGQQYSGQYNTFWSKIKSTR